jgi:aconitate hydratase
VLAESFERIHRSNLIGMGVLPLQFAVGGSVESLSLTGQETITVAGLAGAEAKALIGRRLTVEADGKPIEVVLRIDTPMEAEYLRHGGILQYVLRQHLARSPA